MIHISNAKVALCLVGIAAALVTQRGLRSLPTDAAVRVQVGAAGWQHSIDELARPAVAIPPASVASSNGLGPRIQSQPTLPAGGEIAGRASYLQSCAACHGQQGQGMPHQGPELRRSPFVASRTDEQLAAFVRTGRMPNDPNSMMRLFMPPSGGNPALKDQELARIVRHLRSMQAETAAAAAGEPPGPP
jgi:mono/diheme cytochrome c family protein